MLVRTRSTVGNRSARGGATRDFGRLGDHLRRAGDGRVGPGSPVVSLGNVSVVESQTATLPANIGIGVTASLAHAECVWFHTVNGTAKGVTTITKHDGTQDFVSKPNTALKLAKGATTASIPTSVNYDSVPEANETYTVVVTEVTLPTSAGACASSAASDPKVAIATGSATITIVNDDAASLQLQATPGPVCALPLDPNFRTDSTANYVCQLASPPPRCRRHHVRRRDRRVRQQPR